MSNQDDFSVSGSQRLFGADDVLIDNLSIVLANPEYRKLNEASSGVQDGAETLLESLVLYDKLLFDQLGPHPYPETQGTQYDHASFVNDVMQQLPTGLIQPLCLSDDDRFDLLESVSSCFFLVQDEMENDSEWRCFDWEWFLSSFHNQRHVVRPGADELDFLKFVNEATKHGHRQMPEAAHFFRSTGSIAKQAYYIGLSRFAAIPYVPNYRRNVFFKAFITASNNPEIARGLLDNNFHSTAPNLESAQSTILSYFQNNVINRLDADIDSVLPWKGTSVPLPPIITHIRRLSRKRQCTELEAALELRQTKNAQAFRKWCRQIAEAYRERDRKGLIDLLSNFITSCKRWSGELSDEDSGGTLTLNFFGMGIEANVANPIEALRSRFSRHLLFLRDLI